MDGIGSLKKHFCVFGEIVRKLIALEAPFESVDEIWHSYYYFGKREPGKIETNCRGDKAAKSSEGSFGVKMCESKKSD